MRGGGNFSEVRQLNWVVRKLSRSSADGTSSSRVVQISPYDKEIWNGYSPQGTFQTCYTAVLSLYALESSRKGRGEEERGRDRE